MPLEFDDQDKAEIAKIRGKYPENGAALLPVLHYAQRKFGHLSIDAQLLVADTIGVAPTRVREVVSFYEMFHEHPEGQYHFELCTNISCHLLGGEEMLHHISKRLGIEVGHQTEDGAFSLMEVECLASCGSGPVLKVGEDYYEQLTPEAVDALIDRFRKEAPSLEGRAYVCKNNKPHTGPVPGFESRLPVIATGAAPDGEPKGDKGAALPSFEAPKKKPEAT
jgi:NADH-quinone oxidoreductase subunit E